MIKPVTVGHVIKSHGVGGEMLIHFDPPYTTSIENCRALFVDLDGNPVPYLLESFQSTGEAYIVKLRHIDSRDQSVALHGAEVAINQEELVESGYSGHEMNLSGFVIQHNLGEDLVIESLEKFPQQLMLLCRSESMDSIMIPLVDEWIKEIDEDNERIVMNFPEGLIQP